MSRWVGELQTKIMLLLSLMTDCSTILSPLLHLLVLLGHSILYGSVLVLCNDGCH